MNDIKTRRSGSPDPDIKSACVYVMAIWLNIDKCFMVYVEYVYEYVIVVGVGAPRPTRNHSFLCECVIHSPYKL